MLSLVMGIIGLSLIPAGICAAIYGEYKALVDCILFALLYCTAGFAVFSKTKLTRRHVSARDGYLVVASCWIFACFLGAAVFFFSGQDLTFVQSVFESTAGFTTTGASLLDEGRTAKSMLFFKALAHWIGGMGILVLVVSILPKLGIGGQSIAMAETPTPKIEKVTDRISDTTRILYIMYISFTAIEFVLLLLSRKMEVFDALVNTLSTISTGGFMTHDLGIRYYESVYVETVITVFSFLVTVNFNLYYFLINRRTRELTHNTELRVFMCVITSTSVLIALNLRLSGIYDNIGTALRHSLTQVVSFATTSGFSFAEFTSWPSLSKMLLFLLMMVGGCASSTAGGMKMIRAIVVFKLIFRGFVKRIHPRSVVSIKFGDTSVDSRIISQIATFVITYLFIMLLGTAVLSVKCPSLEVSLCTVVSLLSNTGLPLTSSYPISSTVFGPGLHLFMSLIMIVGRLEIFTILMLFMPAFWNPSRQKG